MTAPANAPVASLAAAAMCNSTHNITKTQTVCIQGASSLKCNVPAVILRAPARRDCSRSGCPWRDSAHHCTSGQSGCSSCQAGSKQQVSCSSQGARFCGAKTGARTTCTCTCCEGELCSCEQLQCMTRHQWPAWLQQLPSRGQAASQRGASSKSAAAVKAPASAETRLEHALPAAPASAAKVRADWLQGPVSCLRLAVCKELRCQGCQKGAARLCHLPQDT